MATTTAQKQQSSIKIRLPHPYRTTYHLQASPTTTGADGIRSYFLRQDTTQAVDAESLPEALHDEDILFTQLAAVEADQIDESNNTQWARARRSPAWRIEWKEASRTPTVGQVWLFLYAFFTLHGQVEAFRLRLQGRGADDLSRALLLSMVAIDHPRPVDDAAPPTTTTTTRTDTNTTPTTTPSIDNNDNNDTLLVLRSAFWQGCASPLGSRPIWLPSWPSANLVPHLEYTIDATQSTYLRHPRRSPKPEPGSVVYSRYIPSLDEHFSLTALDYRNPSHLALFHRWQNDPRVAKGWLESGSLEHHRNYLRALDQDPHIITVLGNFDDVPFAYFEIYWAKEDRMGMHYPAADFDRGRHSLVGEDAFRGAHRVMAWWPSVIHYILLDDHRTENVVGEPRLTGDKVLMYEYMFGLHQDMWMDLPHKRANMVKCSRERFFQLCPFEQHTKHIAGTTFPLPSRL
ncbi:hypothetical protein E4U21_000996 [Claviceps maximensis]|nr:hypothetical protein E4U21_000996 [Claviceps maximensis]